LWCVVVSICFLFFFFFMIWRPPMSTLFPYTTLFRSALNQVFDEISFEMGFNGEKHELILTPEGDRVKLFELVYFQKHAPKEVREDRKSTRLNSSHVSISYAVFCLKKKRLLVLHPLYY